MCAVMVADAVSAVDSAGMAAPLPVVRVEALNHFYGHGQSRSQVLFDNGIEIGAGQLVVMTGPSGEIGRAHV